MWHLFNSLQKALGLGAKKKIFQPKLQLNFARLRSGQDMSSLTAALSEGAFCL